MSISVVCRCGKKFLAKDEHAGARTKCPVCKEPLTIPKPDSARAEAPPRPAQSASPAAPPQPPAAAVGAPPHYEGKNVADWLDLLEVDDPAARKHAVEVLSSIGPEAGTELSAFIDRLAAEHVLIRHWAVTCLERIGPPARPALDALLKTLGDEEPMIREKAALAIERIEPACAAFAARLRHGLRDKNAATRVSAVIAFRRDMKTLGISRCRFWACACGSVYEKEDLEERLKLLADGTEIQWEGTRGCKKCGKSYPLRDVYAGKHDVPQKFWPQLVKRFGNRVQIPDDFLTDPDQESQGYHLSESSSFDVLGAGVPAGYSTMPPPAPGLGEGYALAEPPPVHKAATHAEEAEKQGELVPGAPVPKAGNYKCTACGKVRMSESKSAMKVAAVQSKAVIKYFKSGKTFSECPHCRDLTEWQLVE
ncbi:MAG TPA: HEAT repeat domain-containing protein [Pirellulales bacterium]|nr:HEAT repeat domain-containing protein [Pirellulales bacterium]